MGPVFLIGGGRDEAAVRASHAGFVRAAAGGPIVAIVLDEGDDTDPERWTGALRLAGAADARALVVSPAPPPRPPRPAAARRRPRGRGRRVRRGWLDPRLPGGARPRGHRLAAPRPALR